MLKLENHELRNKRVNLAQRLQELKMHESAVASASEAICSVEAKARQLVQAEGYLSIESLTGLLQYMPTVRKNFDDAEADRKRSKVAAVAAGEIVAGHKARVRGFERVHDRLAAQQSLDVERDAARESDDLWLQRRDSKHD
jgi:hypothetical protein